LSDNQINDKCITKHCILFNTLMFHNTDRGHQQLKLPV